MQYKNIKKLILIRQYLSEMAVAVIGTIIMAFGISFFLLPNQLSTGGFTSIATIIYYLFEIPIGTIILALNIPVFAWAFIRIGKKFTSKAIIGTFTLSIFLDMFSSFEQLTQDRLLACIYGGIITGIGSALVLKAQASTGGTELLTNIIKTYKKDIKTSQILIILDTIVIAVNVFFFKTIEIGLYSAIIIYIIGKMLDIFLEGIYFTKILFIISNKYKEISDTINEKIDRGTTGIYAKGMYTNKEKLMLLCIANRSEIMEIKQIAYKIDPQVFIIIANSREVFGKGFKDK